MQKCCKQEYCKEVLCRYNFNPKKKTFPYDDKQIITSYIYEK